MKVGKPSKKFGKPLRKLKKPLRKIGLRVKKIGFRARKIGFWARKIWIFPRHSLDSGNFGVSLRHQICYHLRAWIYMIGSNYSQLKINHLNNMHSTKAIGGGISVVCLTRTSRYRSKRRSWLVPLLQTAFLP